MLSRPLSRRFCFRCQARVDPLIVDPLGDAICAGTQFRPACGAPLISTSDLFGQDDRYICLNSNGKSAAHDVARPCQEIRDRMGHDFDFPLEEYGVWCNDCWDSDRSIGSRKINYRKLERRVMPEPDEIVQRAVTDIRSYLSGLSHPQLVTRRNALEALAIKNSAQSQIEDLLFTNVLNRMRNGWRWRRQVVLCDAYIVDFIDDSRGAILEIDGVEHALDPKLYWDQVRDAHLRTEGYRIVRLWNGYVHDCIYWSNRLSEAGCDILARRIETYFVDIAEPVAS